MDLAEHAWMRRSLGDEVASLLLTCEDSVIAAGWDGTIKHWDSQGTLLWSALLGNRVNSMCAFETSLFLAVGLDLVCLDLKNGQTRWSSALEGSADEVTYHQGGIIALSSVYDIEHNDFLESALWEFSPDGILQHVHRFDERPWCLLPLNDQILAGLGRPRCGYFTYQEGHLTHIEIEEDMPIMCGVVHEEKVFFGTSNGYVVDQNGANLYQSTQSITHLFSVDTGLILLDEHGKVACISNDGDEMWESLTPASSLGTVGFEVNHQPVLWLANSAGSTGEVILLSLQDGSIVTQGNLPNVRTLTSSEHRVVAGCENGDVFVWEREMLNRRLVSDNGSPGGADEDQRTLDLREKLRQLRHR